MQTERRTALLAAVTAGILIAQQVILKASRDTLFLSHVGVAYLPAVTAAAALVSAVMLFAYSRALTRGSPARVLPGIFAASTVLLAIEWAVGLASERAAAFLVYGHTAIFGAAVISAFWSSVNETFDPHSARRYLGWVTVGAALGGLVGGLVTFCAAPYVRGLHLLLLGAALSALASVIVNRVLKRGDNAARVAEPWSVREPFKQLASLPLLRQLGAVVMLVALLEVLLDYVLSFHATATLGSGPKLLAFFATMQVVTGLGSLLLQLALAQRSLERFGPVGTLAMLPLATLILGGAAFTSPNLWLTALPRSAEGILRASFFRSAYELLFAPMHERQKRAAKIVLDVGFDRLGTLIGTSVLAFGIALGAKSAAFAMVGVLVVAAILVLAAWPIGRSYVRTLGRRIQTGEPMAFELNQLAISRTSDDLNRVELLRQIELLKVRSEGQKNDPRMLDLNNIRSGDPVRVRKALVRVKELDSATRAELLGLLENEALHTDAEKAILEIAPRMIGQLCDALGDTSRDRVFRRRVARILADAGDRRAIETLLLTLDDADEGLGRAAAAALVRMAARDTQIVVPGDRISRAIGRTIQELRSHANEPLSEPRFAHLFALFSLILGREAPLESALNALLSGDSRLKGTALEYLHEVLPPQIRLEAWPFLEGAAQR